jgi:hypothetical protein
MEFKKFFRLFSIALILGRLNLTLGASPVFIPDTNRTDICDRNRAVINGSITIENALKGLTLKVAIAQTQEFLIDNVTGEPIQGYAYSVLQELADLAGFDVEYVWVEAATTSIPWEERLFDVLPHVDFFAGKVITDTIDFRANGVGFFHEIKDNPYKIATTQYIVQAPNSLFSFLDPFDAYLWFAILFVIVVNGILRSFISTKEKKDYSLKKTMVTIYKCFASFTGAERLINDSVIEKVNIVGYSFFILVILTAYTANLTSVLTTYSETRYEINTVYSAQNKGQDICVALNSFESRYAEEYYPDLHLVYVNSTEPSDILRSISDSECKGAFMASSDFIIAEGMKESDPSCNSDFVFVGEDLFPASASFPYVYDFNSSCTSLLKSVLDIYIIESVADFTFSNFHSTAAANASNNDCTFKVQDTSANSSQLTLTEFGGVFLVFLFFFFCSYFFFYYTKRKERLEKIEENKLKMKSVLKRSLSDVSDSKSEPVYTYR